MKLHRLLAIVILAIVIVATSPALASDESAEWRFEVLLNDKPIGFHTFSLSSNGREQVLETEANFDVKLLFITAFRYRHENVETWRDGCLTSLNAHTTRNGDTLDVVGERRDDVFAVSHSGGNETLDDCVQSFAYWNPSILAADRLLNSQTGEYERVDVVLEAGDSVSIGDKTIDADRYTLSAKGGDITLWYARDDRRWLALEAPAKGGRVIRYRPVEVPAAASLEQMTAARND